MEQEFLIADFALQLADNQNGDAAITLQFNQPEEEYTSPAFILSVEAATILRDMLTDLLPGCTFHNDAHSSTTELPNRGLLQ